MRVVYAYRSFTNRCDLIDNPWEAFLFRASLISWMKYAPRVERVIYCDLKVQKFLTTHGYADYLDRIILVNFEKELDKRYPDSEPFFAYPKIWAISQQTKPFFVCDTDGILRCNISDWFEENQYYAVYYPKENQNRTPDYTPFKALCKLAQICVSSPLLQSFCDYTNTINAGLLYFPDPRVAQLVGYTILTAGTDIYRGLEQVRKDIGNVGDDFVWTLYEESLLSNLITFISGKEIKKVMPSQFEECSGIDGTQEWMLSQVQTAVSNLGFKFLQEEYEDLKDCGSVSGHIV